MAELDAGRELDAWIEEHIFGNPVDYEFEEPIVKARRDRYDEWGILPVYSTDIADAFAVLSRLSEAGWHWELSEGCNSVWLRVTTGDYWWIDPDDSRRIGERTAPLAICHMARLLVSEGLLLAP